MSSYTKINYMDIEPGNPDGPVQLRFTRKLLDSKDLGVSYVKYVPDFQSKNAHSHGQQEEVYVVINGSGKALLDGKIEELKKWDVLRVAPETVRAFSSGPEGLEMIIAGGPKPPEGDGQRAKQDWPE
jgi:mannose-6-phosphate isomerase-like protein (cupin superfamily)